MVAKQAAFFLACVLSAAPTFSAEVRHGTNAEIEAMLAGCWKQEITPIEKKFERAGYFNEHQMCFQPGGVVEMWSLGGDDMGIEGFGATGTWKIDREQLRLTGELSDGWLFEGVYDLSCDVLMVPNRGMKLYNCLSVGSGNARNVPDSTFYRS